MGRDESKDLYAYMDADNRQVKAWGARWRYTKAGKWETSVTLTHRINFREKDCNFTPRVSFSRRHTS